MLNDQLSAAEKQKLADAAAAQALRDKLKNSDAELTAMTMNLEAQRRKAEDTLTLLAAAEAAKGDAAAQTKTEADQKAALLAVAQNIISEKDLQITASAKRLALLNQQLVQLHAQLAQLQGLLDASAAKDSANKVQIENLGNQLNSALAQTAAEQKKRADLATKLAAEQKKRADLEAERAAALKAKNADCLSTSPNSSRPVQAHRQPAGRPGRGRPLRLLVRSAVPARLGRSLARGQGADQVGGRHAEPDGAADPASIPWIIRVDGFTDNSPLSGTGQFKDNWELSQARALSVVRYMQNVWASRPTDWPRQASASTSPSPRTTPPRTGRRTAGSS